MSTVSFGGDGVTSSEQLASKKAATDKIRISAFLPWYWLRWHGMRVVMCVSFQVAFDESITFNVQRLSTPFEWKLNATRIVSNDTLKKLQTGFVGAIFIGSNNASATKPSSSMVAPVNTVHHTAVAGQWVLCSPHYPATSRQVKFWD